MARLIDTKHRKFSGGAVAVKRYDNGTIAVEVHSEVSKTHQALRLTTEELEALLSALAAMAEGLEPPPDAGV